MSVDEEWVCPRLLNVPNRLSAAIIAHRSAAQYGQYSAPIYRNSGFPVGPVSVGGGFLMLCKGFCKFPVPTVFETLGSTWVTAFNTAALAGVGAGPAPDGWCEMTTKATTIIATSTSTPPIRNHELRLDWFCIFLLLRDWVWFF